MKCGTTRSSAEPMIQNLIQSTRFCAADQRAWPFASDIWFVTNLNYWRWQFRISKLWLDRKKLNGKMMLLRTGPIGFLLTHWHAHLTRGSPSFCGFSLFRLSSHPYVPRSGMWFCLARPIKSPSINYLVNLLFPFALAIKSNFNVNYHVANITIKPFHLKIRGMR